MTLLLGAQPLAQGVGAPNPVRGGVLDMLARLKRQLPPWFGSGPSPVLNAFLSGPGWILAQAYALIDYARQQTRLRTATGSWLDLAATDLFAHVISRRLGQSDASFRARILSSVLRANATREAVTAALVSLTGRAPVIWEPSRPADTGAWDATFFWDAESVWATPDGLTFFVQAYRPVPGSLQDGAADADIYAVVDVVRAAGVAVWVQIMDNPGQAGAAATGGVLDFSDPGFSGLSALI